MLTRTKEENNAMTMLELPAPAFVERFQSGEIPANARVTVTFENVVAGTNWVLSKLRYNGRSKARAKSRGWAKGEQNVRESRAERR